MRSLCCLFLAALLPTTGLVAATGPIGAASADRTDTLVLPADTAIYAELARDVTSHKKRTAVGDIVPARVWRDVEVDGRVAIEEGSELLLRVAHVKKAKFLGRRGELVLEAVSVRAIDGTELRLDGYQTRDGKGRIAASAALTVAVAWPFLFLRGKNAKVPAGTVLQARTVADVTVTIPSDLADLATQTPVIAAR